MKAKKHTKHKRTPLERQARAIVALLTAPSITAAARRAAVDEKTLRRWLQEPAFASELARRRTDALDVAVAGLMETAGLSVERLRKLVSNHDPAIALRASRALLTLAIRQGEAAALTDRLAALERALLGPGATLMT